MAPSQAMTDRTETLSLSQDFDGNDEAAWRALTERALKGRPIDRLASHTVDGLTLAPLSRETDFPSAADPLGHPGAAPFLRGAEAERDRFVPWDIRQGFNHPDPATTNADILRDLQRGVSSIELTVDPTGATGVAMTDLASMSRALDGVIPSIATVSISRSGAAGLGLATAATLALWAETTAEPKAAKLAFNLDPLGTLARTGLLEIGLDAAFRDTATLAQAVGLRFPHATVFRADGQVLHEAGSGPVMELAGTLASLVDTVRRLEAIGVKRDETVAQLLVTLATGPDYFREIAKVRAFRRLHARCLDVLGLDPQPARIQAVTSARMMTRQDPWVNMLRVTAATFAAGVGGADIVTALPFTHALGVPEELARRVARNTQIIAQSESHLGRVADPAGGSWTVEAHAEDLAQAAWERFQEIEAEGGYGSALLSGWIQDRIAKDRAELRRRVATRKMPLTGTSSFPTLDEVEAPVAEVPALSFEAEISESELDQLLTQRATPADEPDACDPLWPIRLSEPFERLRDLARARGDRATVLAVCLGELADYTARLDFVRHLFASGGLSLDVVEYGDGHLPEGHAVAVICGSDEAYGDTAMDAAGAINAAGVSRIFLAGKPGDAEAGLRDAGVSDFVFMGCNAIEALERAHAELGLKP